MEMQVIIIKKIFNIVIIRTTEQKGKLINKTDKKSKSDVGIHLLGGGKCFCCCTETSSCKIVVSALQRHLSFHMSSLPC